MGRYDLLDVLGEGGMGTVYRARDRELGREVAIKVLKPAFLGDPRQIERFQREERHTARLVHPSIVAVHEVGIVGGVPYYTMPLISGTPLQEVPGNLERRVRILEKVSRAVHYAHERGVIHRDLKPQNILVDSEGEPRLLDFGLSRDLQASSELTLNGAVFGTPSYMAPEQAEGRVREVDARSDVYALGTMLYELLAGVVPFTGESAAEVLRRVITEEPKVPGGPRDLASVALKALEKDPSRRYPTAAEFADELTRYLRNEPVKAVSPGTVRRVRCWVERHSTLALSAVFVAVLAGLSAWAATRTTPSPLPHPIEAVFEEDFERFDPSRWNERPTKPPGFEVVSEGRRGGKCLRMTIPSDSSGGGVMYKMLQPGLERAHFRFYVKAERGEGFDPLRFGFVGYNPPTAWSQGYNNAVPDGKKRFTSAVEVARTGTWKLSSRWCDMSPDYERSRGDIFVPQRPATAEPGRWICVELMLKCNRSPETSDGEQALWIDGREVGRWSGFRWRTDPQLKVNGFRIIYVDYEPRPLGPGEVARPKTLWIDDLVVSDRYIGPAKE